MKFGPTNVYVYVVFPPRVEGVGGGEAPNSDTHPHLSLQNVCAFSHGTADLLVFRSFAFTS